MSKHDTGGGTFTVTLAVLLLATGLGLAMAAPAGAQPDLSAAARCSGHHGFGAEPVDIAKTADNSVVLARAHWGYSAERGICYLVLDDAAVQVLRDKADQMPDPMLGPDLSAAARCSGHHGFGAEPVDIAKTADNSVVLARAHWGYSAERGICYLVLDEVALSLLRERPVAAFSDGALPPSAGLSSTSSQVSEDPGRGAVRHIRVDYCGPYGSPDALSMAGLRREVEHLQTHVDSFIERQSGYLEDESSTRRSRLVFEAGYILHPAVDWDSQSIADWYNQYLDAHESSRKYSDPCRKEAAARGQENEDIYPDVLILADLKAGGIVGYAPKGGPALAVTRNQYDGNSDMKEVYYLETVAHEIGHAFYGFSHPWADLFGTSDPDHLTPSEVQEYLNRYTEAAQSLMSYYEIQGRNTGKRPDIRAGAADHSRAYIACYQRQNAGWPVGPNCEFPELTPETPDPPTVTPGDGQITVSWRAPNDRGSEILEYHVQYQSEHSSTWFDVDWDWEFGAPLRTTITGLANNTEYFFRVRAENRVGQSQFFSAATSGTPQAGRPPTVTLTVGDSAQGARGADGICSSVHCRWLHVEIENLGPGPHTLACAHNGVAQIGAQRGVYKSEVVTESTATRSCLFGYPGAEVFVIVGAERRDNAWHGGTYSNVVVWPHAAGPDRPEIRISWGSDASNRPDCPANTSCRNLSYEFIGDWGPAPYTLACRGDGHEVWEGQWSGRASTACYYWGGPGQTAQVVIDGIASNTITWPEGPLPTREVRIYSGTDASSRAGCPQGRSCVNLRYEYIGNWNSPPYSLECWSGSQRLWGPGTWSGRETTGCYYTTGIGQRVHAVVNGVQSNTITIP